MDGGVFGRGTWVPVPVPGRISKFHHPCQLQTAPSRRAGPYGAVTLPSLSGSTCGLGVPQGQHGNPRPHWGTWLGILAKNHCKEAGAGPACPAGAGVCAGNVSDAPSPVCHTPCSAGCSTWRGGCSGRIY